MAHDLASLVRGRLAPLTRDDTGILRSPGRPVQYEEVPSERARQLFDAISLHGVRKALQMTLMSTDSISADFIFDPRRGRFLDRIAQSRRNRIALEIGAGYGPIVRALARHFDNVVAVEAEHDRIKFAKAWLEEEQIVNVEYICAGIGEVQLRENAFDLIVMNGALEWVPFEFPTRQPRDTQLDVLREAHSALRPGGCLYVAIENRFALYAFAGHREPHTGIRFHSVVPRILADILSQIYENGRRQGVPAVRNHHKYLNHTYSLEGYRRLFKDAGFESTSVTVPWPSYNRPNIMVEDTETLIGLYKDHSLYRLAWAIGRVWPTMAWWLAPGFGLYARKSEVPNVLL